MAQKVAVVGVFPQEGLEPEEYVQTIYGAVTPDQALAEAFRDWDDFDLGVHPNGDVVLEPTN